MRTLYAMIRDVEESLNTAVDVANHSSSSEERIEAVASARAATEALRHMLAVTDGAEGRKALSDTLRRVNTVLQVSWGRRGRVGAREERGNDACGSCLWVCLTPHPTAALPPPLADPGAPRRQGRSSA